MSDHGRVIANSSSGAEGFDANGLPRGYAFKPEWEVTAPQTAARLASGNKAFVLLDCRRPEEWQTARIEGAVLIPMNEIERRADELETDEGGKDREIVVHCHHGVRSMRVAAMLRGMGFTNVKSMAGGIEAWSVAVDGQIARY